MLRDRQVAHDRVEAVVKILVARVWGNGRDPVGARLLSEAPIRRLGEIFPNLFVKVFRTKLPQLRKLLRGEVKPGMTWRLLRQ